MSDQKSRTPSNINLGDSTESLQTIIDQKKKAMEVAIKENESKTKKRHLRLIKSLIRIRNSFRGLERIDMGERFSLQLILDDNEGWPRMALRTIDNLNPSNDFASLVVSSHDRQDSGSIEFKSSFDKKPSVISLSDPNNLTKLSLHVKKHLRDYLDFVGDKVVKIEQDEAGKRKTFYEDENKQKNTTSSNDDNDPLPLSLD